MNELYNHPKIKAMVSLTKGEGFGRPLLEFSMINKPIIASNWSGHIDFLDPEFSYLVNGELKNVHPSTVVPNMILAESQWFSPNHGEIGNAFRAVFENYKDAAVKGKRLGFKNRKEFSWDAMKDKMKIIFDEIDSKIPRAVALKLPQLRKIELPKLTKIEPQK
jgi:glycosyltransferase involved in cell wall biosynthesis